jgi:hypothetical protein
LPESLRAPAQHIKLLQDKRRTLCDAQLGAELQFLAALRREYDAGNTTWPQLRDAYVTLSAGRLRGLDARWLDAMPVSPAVVIAKAQRETTGAGRVWKGHRPLLHGEQYPPAGQCVVYVLFDAEGHPIYVNNTNRCAQRLADHQAHHKQYSMWVAHGCVDRAEANEVEARFSRRYRLNLSRQRARASA